MIFNLPSISKRIVRSFFIVFTLLLTITPALRAQVVGWSHPASNPPYGVFSYGVAATSYTELGRSVCTDVAGNVYVYGLFGTGADFDPGAGTTTLTANNTSSNAADMFVAKYNSAGALQWVVRGGVANSTDNNGGNLGSICTDGTNVYVVGALNINATNSGDFAPAAGGCSCAYSSAGTLSLGFVAKLSASSGQWQWVQPWGATTAQNQGQGVCLDPTGNVYVVGQCNGTITLGPSSFVCSDAEAFFGKINSSGVWQWATHGGGAGGDGAGTSGGSISYNVNLGRVTATGAYNSTGVTFGSFPLPNTAGVTDIYLAELNPANGAFLNAIGFGGAIVDEAASCYDPATHDVFLAGQISSSITLPGTGTLNFPGGGTDIFVARYTPNATPTSGTFTWAKSYGLGGTDRAWGIASDGIGSILVCGTYSGSGTIDFGSGAATQVSSTGTFNEMFVASVLASNGNGIWAIQGADNGSSGTVNDQIRGICARQDGTGISYAVGQLGIGSVAFTPSSLGNGITRSSAGGTDVFIGKIFGVLPLTATQSQVNLTCNGVCTGSATVVASGGIAPYTYSWSPSGGSNATASSLCATNYTVTITDAASSSITKTFNLTQPSPIIITPVSQTNVSCFGGANGAAQVTASGGIGTLTYNWTPGSPAGDGTGSVTGLTAQAYTVTVTDANSCTATRTFNITQPSAPVSGTTVVTNVSCFGGNNGAINLTPTGGSGGYTFNWLPSGPNIEDRTGLIAGTYSVQITDVNGCTGTVTATVTQPTSPVSGTTVVTNVSCFGGNNGAINLTPTGGTGPYTFNWLPSGPTTEDRTGLIAGTYSVQITDVNGCTGTVTATVTQPTSPVSGTTVVTNVSCFGGNNGAINLTPTGGTGPYTFNWLPSGPTTEDRTGLIAGTYSVQITDVNGCTGTVTATVTQPTSPVSGTTVVTNVSCFGGSNGTINLTPTGGTGPYTFNWLPSGPTTEDRTGLIAGTYSVQITDLNGCTGTVTATVTQPTSPVSGTTVVTNVSCFGGNNGAINLTPTGGTGPYTFNWLPSGPTTEDRTGLIAGTYSVQITDLNGCTGTVTATVTQPTSPVSGTTVVTNVSCFGGSNGAINLTPTGGTGPYTFNWLPSGPTTEDRTGLIAGTYSVQVTDVNGCTGTVTATVTQPTSPVSGTTVVTNVACFGGSTGAINLTPTGGTGPYTFNWLPSGPTTEDRTGLIAGTYSVQITDLNGCTGTVTATITQPTSPVSGTTVVTNVSCFGGSNGTINLTPAGGTGPYTFNWLPSGPTTEDRTGLIAGTYSVQITDLNGCTGTVTATVTQPTSPVSGTTVVTNVSCFGGSNGAINLTPTGGTGPYTFNWLPSGPTTEDRTGLIAGTYSVQITDLNGCTGTVTATVTQPTSPVSGTTVVTNVACFGGSTGAINLTPTGGTGPYTFNWLPSGPTTEDRTGLIAGTYSVQITDLNGCTGTVTATVTQPTSPVSGTTVVTNVACFGGSTGAINLTPAGGTGPYTFNWLPSGPTTEDRTGLIAGTYSVQITDLNGCTATVTATVTQPTSPVSGTTVVTNVSCFGGNNGAINLTPTGGTGPYTFNWLPSGPTTEDRTGLIAGTYSVQITDLNGCTGTVTATVTQPTSPVSGTTVVTNVACFGGSTGAINLTPTGGTGPYTFNWLPSGPTTEDRTGLIAGTYSVQITDLNGCTGTVTATVTQPPAIVVTPVSQTNVSCSGGSNGAASVTATGGTGTLTYNWTPGNPTGDGTNAVTGLTFGVWTCTVTDANGCTATATFNITQPPPIVVTPTAQTNVSCNGGSNGAAAVTASGGTGTFTYNWTPGNPTGDGTNSVTGLTFGVWTCTVTDANGCTATATFNITQPPAIVVTPVSQTNVACNGGNNGSASVTASGGTGTLTYNWTPGNPTGDGTNSVSGLTFGVWTCTVTDANGCTSTATFNITQPTPLAVTFIVTNVLCNGDCNGSITAIVTGGTPPYSYMWTPIGQTTPTLTGLCAGTYTFIVTDANGCQLVQTVTITQPPAIVSSIVSQTNVSCNGGSNGGVIITASGGTGTLSYNWTPGNPSGDGTNSVTGLTAGIWTCTITDANGCTRTQTVNITQPPVITSSISSTNVSCFGGANGTATVTASGGTGTFTYSWSPTGGNAATATGLSAGPYVCTITDGNLCTATQSVTILEPTALAVVTTQINATCAGVCNGSAAVSVTGGTPSYNYLWAPGGQTTPSINAICAGTYTCIITDANGCIFTATFTITEPSPIVATASQTDVACNGGSDGTATVTASGGTGTLLYAWSPTGGNAATATGLSAGPYSCLITDANGCTLTETFLIAEPSAITSTSMQTNVSCFGGNNGEAMVMATGGTGTLTYNWQPTGGTNAMAMNLIAGSYSCIITDANSCSLTVTFLITEPSSPLAVTSTQTDILCNGGTGDATVIVTGGTMPYDYSWTSGGTNATETGLLAGSYVCTITDDNGCVITQSVTLTEPAVLTASVTSTTNPSSCGNTDGMIDITVSGGTTAYTFAWSNSAVTEDLNGVAAGTYTCLITDANGCTTTVSATINDPNAPLVTVQLPMDTACGSFPGLITLSGESPTGGTWSGVGVSGNTFDPFGAGMGWHFITYTFTDISGCTGSTTDSIFVDPCIGIETLGTTGAWSLFPNPTNGAITITSPVSVNGNVMIQVYATNGKLIMSETKTDTKNIALDLSQQPVGIYFIRITANDAVTVYRLVKI